MVTTVTIAIIGFLAGMLGTGLGGLSSYLIRNPSKRFFSIILGLSGGLMMAIVCFDLLPQAFMMVGPVSYTHLPSEWQSPNVRP